MTRRFEGLFIDGVRRPAADGATFTTVDPSTRLPIADVGLAGEADVHAAVDAAAKAFAAGSPWRRMSARDRARLMRNLVSLIERDADDLALLETQDAGKPVAFSKSVDIAAASDTVEYYAGWAERISGSVPELSLPDLVGHVTREPVGVCALISAWNFPLGNAVWKIAPALAAGCTVVYKTAEQAPLTVLRFAELVMEAGFPAGVVNIVNGGPATGRALVSHPGVDKVAFTGSVATGRAVGTLASQHLKRVTLELGGKSPNIVLADADIEAAIEGSFFGMYFNSGQVCSAASRLLVHRDRFDEVVQGIAKRAADTVLGPATQEDVFMGPLISAEHHARVSSYVQVGCEEAELVAGGNTDPLGDGGWFVEPTLFVTDRDDAVIVREEIFGPVLVAQSFDSIDEVVRRANDTEFGLAAGVWTQDVTTAGRIASQLRAGSVYVNSFGEVDPAMPFGGFKSSGVGRELGADGLNSYLESKSIYVRR